jgi:hypothetical protein
MIEIYTVSVGYVRRNKGNQGIQSRQDLCNPLRWVHVPVNEDVRNRHNDSRSVSFSVKHHGALVTIKSSVN